jgi:glycosyltransferase involved in cell wall biosynthesis
VRRGPVRVALDMTPAVVGGTGVARYAEELAAALEAAGTVVRRFSIARHPDPDPRRRHLRIPRRWVERAWSVAKVPRAEWLVPGIDVVHATDLVPVPSRHPSLVTVHDLAALEHPHLHPAVAVEQQRRQLRALERATLVLAVSETTAHALERHGVARDRVAVTPLGLRTAPPIGGPPTSSEPFILAVGELHPRKGLDLLVRAVARSGTGLTVVFAGPGDPAALRAIAAECGVDADMRFLGRVDEPVLSALYRDALMLCAPSRAEGFGLNVLEALGAGLPVVASELAVFREVAGEAAVLVPSEDEQRFADVIARVASSPSERERLARAGRARSSAFTWARTAELTVAAYERALTCA